MLTKLQLRNFQRHRSLVVDLDPEVTAVIGPSDSGKSSVLRALRWLALNKPRGDGFVRCGAEGAAVRLKVDGRKLERSKRGDDNSYSVDGKKLRSFGTDVPESVSSVLSMDELNFQGQHESPFWFSLTAGEVARRLNEIVDLGEIDRVAAELAALRRKAKAEVEVVGDRLREAEGALDRLGFVGEMDGELVGLEDRQEENASQRALYARLTASLAEAVRYRDLKRSLGDAASGGLGVVSVGSRALKARDGADALRDLLSEVAGAKRLAGMEVPGMCGIDNLRSVAGKRRSEVESMDELIESVDDWREKRDELYNDLVLAGEKLDEETEGVCPICGGELL